MFSRTTVNRRDRIVCLFVAFGSLATSTLAVTKVAVIDDGIDSNGTQWCAFLDNNGYECMLFPPSGPTIPLDEFAVVIDMSEEWDDPQHILADFLQSGKGVITWGLAPLALGINTDPVVQAWIGANDTTAGTGSYVTTAVDSILGPRPPGTQLGHAGKFGGKALENIGGHAEAKVLARFTSGLGTIALLSNRWETGRSVYFSDEFSPEHTDHAEIVLLAMGELSKDIPTTSLWGLLILTLLLLIIGSIYVPRIKNHPGSKWNCPTLR